MTIKQSFRVAVAGLDMRDVRLIEIVFKHSQYNRYEFKLVTDITPGSLDLLIANAHDEAGKAAIFALREGDTAVPIIAAVPRGEASTAKHAISIDRLTLQLLPIINRVVELDLLSPETKPMDRQAQVKFAAAERVNQVERRNLATRFVPSSVAGTPPQRGAETTNRLNPMPASSAPQSLAPQSPAPQSPAPQAPAPQAPAQFASAPQITAQPTAQPVAPMPQEAPQAARTNLVSFPTPREAVSARQRLRVLIVDDSPTVRQQLGGALEKIGFLVDLAATGSEALNRLDSAHYDLALVDVVMPEMDGYKLTREIKKVKSRKGMPVIILTSKSSPFDLARGALAGCDSFLSKPVPLRELQDAIVKHLRKSLAIDDLSEVLNLNGAAGLSPQKAMTSSVRSSTAQSV